jgi:peptidoglycan/LPS O-acetylase OafA/YrhL
MNYRPHIDGLRAIAVISVLLYHFDYAVFGGGFVGVDVFFVISGYLITGIIAREIEEKRFSFAKFYERRIRRILPAFIAVLTISFLAAVLILLPTELKNFSASALAALAVAANLWFWKSTGYFDPDAESNPLLHTWTLSVEEQFYIVFPFLLLLLFRTSRRGTPWILAAFALVSLALSVMIIEIKPPVAFYLPVFRAWELLMGCILALHPSLPSKSKFSEALSWLGLGMILYAVFAFNADTAFPGFPALLPCGGAVLLIYAGGNSRAGRMLSWKPLVFLGLISYSLYLWHWPILVFTRLWLHRPLLGWENVLLIAISLMVAIFSWRWIEQPFRKKGVPALRPRLFLTSFLIILALAGVYAWVWQSGGLPGRFDSLTVALDKETIPEKRIKGCTGVFLKGKKMKPCEIGSLQHGAPTSVLIWGDSHSFALHPALEEIFSLRGIRGIAAGMDRCPPLFGIENEDKRPLSRTCYAHNNFVMEYLKTHPDVRHAILAAAWSRYSNDASKYVLADKTSGAKGNELVFGPTLKRTVETLRMMGISVTIVGMVPGARGNVPVEMLKSHRFGTPQLPATDRLVYRKENKRFMAVVAEMASWESVQFIDMSSIFCPSDSCIYSQNGLPLFWDKGHLNSRGALFALPLLRAGLEKNLALPPAAHR